MTAPDTGAHPAAAVPVLRLVRGLPTPEELAAVVAVLAARSGGTPVAGSAPPRSRWSSRETALRRPVRPGPGAWRACADPHR